MLYKIGMTPINLLDLFNPFCCVGRCDAHGKGHQVLV